MAGRAWAAKFVLAMALMASSVAGQSIDIERLIALPKTGDIVSAYVLPNNADKRFTAGKMVDIVVGLHNEGSEAYNVSFIAGSLNSPVDFNIYVQNFSQIAYGHQLAPGEQVSLEYKFFPDPRLDARDFVVALTVVYSTADQKSWHSLTAFNETISIVEVKQLIDWELISLFLIFGAGIAGILYAVYSYVVSQGWIKSQKKRGRAKRAPGTEPRPMSAEHQQDWVQGTPYDALVKSKARAAAAASKRAAAAAK